MGARWKLTIIGGIDLNTKLATQAVNMEAVITAIQKYVRASDADDTGTSPPGASFTKNTS